MRPKSPGRAMVEIRYQNCTRTITNTAARHKKNIPFGPWYKFVTKRAPAPSRTPPQGIKNCPHSLRPKYDRKHKFGPGSVLATSRQPEVKMRPNTRPFLSHCPPLLLLSCSIRPNIRAIVQIRDQKGARTITNTTARH